MVKGDSSNFTRMKRVIYLVCLLLSSVGACGQTPTGKMDYFREHGILTLYVAGEKVSDGYEHESWKGAGILDDAFTTGTWSRVNGDGEMDLRFNRDLSKFKIRYNQLATADSPGAIWKMDTPLADGNLNHRYYMEQYNSSLTGRSFDRTNPVLNPFAWAQFFRGLKKNKKNKKK